MIFHERNNEVIYSPDKGIHEASLCVVDIFYFFPVSIISSSSGNFAWNLL